MVEEENLEALDFMLWMAGSHRAAALTHTNQSTVIRRARHVLSIFGSDITRSPLGWHNRGSEELLRMERVIHQQFRFRGRKPLRLHVPFWSHRTVQGRLPKGWLLNGADPSHTCENPLDLLRDHVIDACILTPTQLEDAAGDLLRIELYQSSIDLTVFQPDSADPPPPRQTGCEELLEEGRPLTLQQFGFLPRSCRRASRLWFQKMAAAAAEEASPGAAVADSRLRVAFLTPEMRRTVTTPFVVDHSHPRSYREHLVILREHACEPLFQQLLDAVQPVFTRIGEEGVTLLH